MGITRRAVERQHARAPGEVAWEHVETPSVGFGAGKLAAKGSGEVEAGVWNHTLNQSAKSEGRCTAPPGPGGLEAAFEQQ